MLSSRATIQAGASMNNATATANSIANRKANQNGNAGVKSNGGTGVGEDNSVNLTGNNFYVRSDNDIHMLASEIAALTKSQQRSLGGAY